MDYLVKGLRTPWAEWGYRIEKRTRPSTELDLSKYRYVRRNETCPCGSEKKYKKCCLDKLIEVYDHYQFEFLEQPEQEIAKLVPNAYVEGIDDMVSRLNSQDNTSDSGLLVEARVTSTLITADGTSLKL